MMSFITNVMLFWNLFVLSNCSEIFATSSGWMVKPSGNDATAAAAALVAGEPLFSGVPNMLLCVIGNRKNFSTRMYVARIISGSTP